MNNIINSIFVSYRGVEQWEARRFDLAKVVRSIRTPATKTQRCW